MSTSRGGEARLRPHVLSMGSAWLPADESPRLSTRRGKAKRMTFSKDTTGPETGNAETGLGASSVSIVVPVYREAENLPHLIPAIAARMSAAGLVYEIILVDDDSRDGTEQVAADLAKEYPLRLLVRRNERGLSTAVIHGFRHARGDILVCMDADLSHPPELIASLVAAVRSNEADFAIGSRYIPGAFGIHRTLYPAPRAANDTTDKADCRGH